MAITSGKQSAGLLLYRQKGGGIEVLLGHPGGPFWRRKDLASWSIPKGLIAVGEDPLTAAKREFTEETGHSPRVPLGEAKQPRGKIVHVWAVEDDWNPEDINSNMFEMEWPPRSGRRQISGARPRRVVWCCRGPGQNPEKPGDFSQAVD